MMNSLKRFYNQNTKGIWLVIIVIALFIVVLQLANSYIANRNENNTNSLNFSSQQVNTGNKNIIVTSENTTALGESVSKDRVTEDSQLITIFINYCNDGNLEGAYNMLTNECKEEMFSTLDDFRTYYYGNMFNESKVTFEIENWVNNTYKVDIIPDMLATGKANNTVKQDYITIANENGEDKLNINNYIGRSNIEKSEEKDNVKITVNYKDTYMDYERYNITIQNNGNTKVILDSLEDLKTMYIEDRNEIQYSAYTHEITNEQMAIDGGTQSTIEIRYYSTYVSTKEITRLVFSDFNNGKYESESEEFIINI